MTDAHIVCRIWKALNTAPETMRIATLSDKLRLSEAMLLPLVRIMVQEGVIERTGAYYGPVRSWNMEAKV
jgi:DNA-binding Lrp family transcriptional regulator